MPYQPGQGKTAVGLFVDGLELKYVQLSFKGGKTTLRDFRTVALVKKFEEKLAPAAEGGEAGFGDINAADAFGGGATAAAGEAEEAATNSSVLLGLLSDLPPSKYSLSYALSEPAVTYQEFESNFGLKGLKLKKRLVEELSATRSEPPSTDGVETIPTATGALLAVIREDGLHLFDLLMELRSFLGGRLPNVDTMHSSDIASIELVRSSYAIQEEEVTVLVYVGHDFSRLIFMQGQQYLHFAPIISEGYGSPNVENTIYSRILLEQDNIALTRIDRILLSGEGHKINLVESLGPQFSNALVEYVKIPDLDLGEFQGTVGEGVSEYAIPIITAWKALERKRAGFYDFNIIPLAIVEGQKAFKLAWHGWIAAVLIVGSIVFFYTSILSRAKEIRQSRDELTQKQAKMAELDLFTQRRDQLNADINRYINATTTYDSIAPGSDRWSRILHYLANSVEDLNSTWIYSIRPSAQNPTHILISGRTVYRNRIPRIASIFERAILNEVRTTTIRSKPVYEFDIVVEKVDKYDVPEPLLKAR